MNPFSTKPTLCVCQTGKLLVGEVSQTGGDADCNRALEKLTSSFFSSHVGKPEVSFLIFSPHPGGAEFSCNSAKDNGAARAGFAMIRPFNRLMSMSEPNAAVMQSFFKALRMCCEWALRSRGFAAARKIHLGGAGNSCHQKPSLCHLSTRTFYWDQNRPPALPPVCRGGADLRLSLPHFAARHRRQPPVQQPV